MTKKLKHSSFIKKQRYCQECGIRLDKQEYIICTNCLAQVVQNATNKQNQFEKIGGNPKCQTIPYNDTIHNKNSLWKEFIKN